MAGNKNYERALAETGGAGDYPDRDVVGNPRSRKGSIEERVQRQIQAQLAAAHQRKLARQELQQAAPDLTPIADRLARKRYNRGIDEMARASASDANLHNTVQALYREAALEYKRRQGLDQGAGDE